MAEIDRDHDQWVATLGRDGAARDSALSELRNALLRNLRKALATRPGVDEAFLDDAVQNGMLRVLDRLSQFAGRSRFPTWATTITIHHAMSELRRKRWKDVSLDAVLADAELNVASATNAASSTDSKLELQDILGTLRKLVDSELTERQRTALLAELKGMPLDEIARHLGSNRNAVYKLTHDARKKLKHGLEAAGYTADTVVAAVSR
jgi:RNA polymerase sigma-70 factor (ECF subfamily)